MAEMGVGMMNFLAEAMVTMVIVCKGRGSTRKQIHRGMQLQPGVYT